MSALATAPRDSVPAEALELHESFVALPRDDIEMPAELVEAYSDEMRQKMVPLHIIRPGVGRGRGNHLYEARMLEENAHKFRGWKMYVDHLSPVARKAAGGLPRSLRDLGGRIAESYWDPNVPPSGEHGQGAVVGWAIPTPFVRSLIDNDPEIVEASISSNATGVHRTEYRGQRVWCVEGIEDRGSVDWVTEAGAGGRVVALMESVYADTEEEMRLLESLTDDEFIALVRELRPHLVEEGQSDTDADRADEATDAVEDDRRVDEAKASGSGDGDTDNDADADNRGGVADGDEDDSELEAAVAAMVKKGMPRALAVKAAKKKLAEATADESDEPTPGEDMGITPEALQEALQDEGFRDAIQTLVDEHAATKLAEMREELSTANRTALEEALADERELIRAEARADAARGIELRDMRDEAHTIIEAARLPEAWRAKIRERFTLTESGQPTSDLDVVDDVDDDGNVTKTARAKLQEAVAAALDEQRTLLAAANPTRVKGLGPQNAREGDSAETKKGDGTLWGAVLQEAGVDPATAYAS